MSEGAEGMKNPNFSFALWEWEHAPRREEVVAAAITSYVQARLSRPGPYGGIDINELLAKQPKRRAARYRNLAEVRRTIVAELCDAGYSQKEVGQVFGGRSQASISVLLNPVCLECFRSMHTRSRGVCGSCYRRHLAAGDYADVGELKGTQHGNHAFHLDDPIEDAVLQQAARDLGISLDEALDGASAI